MNYFVHESSYVDENVEIGEGTKIWHFCHVQEGAKIGKNCVIGQNTYIAPGVEIGNNVKIQNNVSIYKGITIESDVFIGPSAVFTNVLNPRSFVERKDEFKDTLIREGASIGANATIICGNNIGEYSFVGAGSVVTKRVSPYSMVCGIPARRAKWICRFNHSLKLVGETHLYFCEECEEYYAYKTGEMKREGK